MNIVLIGRYTHSVLNNIVTVVNSQALVPCICCIICASTRHHACMCLQIVDELREQILKLRFPHRVQNKEATPKTKRKIIGHPSPSKSPSIPAPKPALSDRPCVVVLNKPLEKLLIRSGHMTEQLIVTAQHANKQSASCTLLEFHS